jgi:hypothetical protein
MSMSLRGDGLPFALRLHQSSAVRGAVRIALLSGRQSCQLLVGHPHGIRVVHRPHRHIQHSRCARPLRTLAQSTFHTQLVQRLERRRSSTATSTATATGAVERDQRIGGR